MSEIIRQVQPGDETELTAMIHELAEFEHATANCTVTENQLREALFGDHPTVYGHIAEVDGQAAAGALWFRNFSTWDGVAGIYLEEHQNHPLAQVKSVFPGSCRLVFIAVVVMYPPG